MDEKNINLVSDKLEEAAANSDTVKVIRNLNNAETKEDMEKVIPVKNNTEVAEELEIDKDLKDVKIETPVIDESVETINKFKNDENLPLEEVSKILEINNRIKKNEKFSVYNELPPYFKSKLRIEAGKLGIPATDHRTLNMMARSAIQTLISEANIDKGFDELQEELKKVTNIPNVPDIYMENLRTAMESSMLKNAEKYKETKPELYEKLKKVSGEFTSAYMLDKQYNYIKENNSKLTKFIKMSRPERLSRLCDDFDYILDKSEFKHESVRTLLSSLTSLNILTKEQVEYYIILLCLICRNMHHDNIYEVTFMYYSVRLVNNLQYISKVNATEFSSLFISNIKQLCKTITDSIDKQLEV